MSACSDEGSLVTDISRLSSHMRNPHVNRLIKARIASDTPENPITLPSRISSRVIGLVAMV